MFRLERELKFDAAHRLPGYDGKCSNLHGHTWRVKVGYSAPDINPETGMLVDFSKIKGAVEQLDHRELNSLIDNPTAENIAEFLFLQFTVMGQMSGCRDIQVDFVEVWEGEGSMIRRERDVEGE